MGLNLIAKDVQLIARKLGVNLNIAMILGASSREKIIREARMLN